MAILIPYESREETEFLQNLKYKVRSCWYTTRKSFDKNTLRFELQKLENPKRLKWQWGCSILNECCELGDSSSILVCLEFMDICSCETRNKIGINALDALLSIRWKWSDYPDDAVNVVRTLLEGGAQIEFKHLFLAAINGTLDVSDEICKWVIR
jgi:hypothetical protein